MKVKPLGDRILVKRQEAEEKTASGIFLPDTAREKPQYADVVEVGEGKLNTTTGKREALGISKGDTVLLSKWGGTEVKVGDDAFLIINADDVLAVVE